jgi:c-di-AMP phosphodiesterase-like protein
MRTQAFPTTLSIGNLGTFDLFSGAEVQLAESATVTQIAEDMLTLPEIEASTVLAKTTDLQKVNRNVIKASKLIPANETI